MITSRTILDSTQKIPRYAFFPNLKKKTLVREVFHVFPSQHCFRGVAQKLLEIGVGSNMILILFLFPSIFVFRVFSKVKRENPERTNYPGPTIHLIVFDFCTIYAGCMYVYVSIVVSSCYCRWIHLELSDGK